MLCDKQSQLLLHLVCYISALVAKDNKKCITYIKLLKVG